jgi:hypothetical protein
VHDAWPYILLGLLGAYHGINPAMGWLFAVALGMQERSRRAVLRSLLPIAIGHECSIVLVAVLVVGLGLVADTHVLHVAAGMSLIAFGIFRFVRPRAHFRWGAKLRVNRRELGWWSFLMSTAHGAGLMVAPVLIGAGATAAEAAPDHDLEHVHAAMISPAAGGLALLLHVASMMLVMAIVSVVVYEKLGVAILRQAWLNTEWLWAGAFVMAGFVTLFT